MEIIQLTVSLVEQFNPDQQLHRGGLASIGSFSVVGVPLYQNTYRLEAYNPFNPFKVKTIIEEIIKKQCVGLMYDAATMPKLVQTLAQSIRQEVKALNFDRYKLMVLVQIGEKKLQGFESAVKFLWDTTRDSFATFSYENNTMFVTASCFGVYRE